MPEPNRELRVRVENQIVLLFFFVFYFSISI